MSRSTRYTDKRKAKGAGTSVVLHEEPHTNAKLGEKSENDSMGKATNSADEEWNEEAGYYDEESLIGKLGSSDEDKWTDEPGNDGDESDVEDVFNKISGTNNKVSNVKYSLKWQHYKD